jgi:hypothetical protein
MMKIYAITGYVFFMLLSIEGKAQVIINGDFEVNTTTSCLTNITNSQYTDVMSNSWGFGSHNEIDIQNDSCGFATVPSHNWFVSLAKDFWGVEYDELSLEISSSLVAGNSYDISYFSYSTDYMGNNNIPIEIGLSIDSISFGTLIHSSTPNINTWTQQSFTFVAPNNGKYLTVRTDSAGVLYGWNFVDKFELSHTNGLEETLNLSIKVAPNPSSGIFTVNVPDQINIQSSVFDALGKLVTTSSEKGTFNLDLSDMPVGIYTLRLDTESGTVTKKLVRE